MDSNTSRRVFIKIILATTIIVVTGLTVTNSSVQALLRATNLEVKPKNNSINKSRKWVRIIDLNKCNGCKECTKACQQAHLLDPQQMWIKVYKIRNTPISSEYYLPRPCMHCEKPPCVKVCPTGASYQREDGIVLVNQEICIGCRLCMAACPYDARYFNWGEPRHPPEELTYRYRDELPIPQRRGVVTKCVACAYRLEEGLLPVCVVACPEGAMYFGEFYEGVVSNGREFRKISELLRKRNVFRYKEDLGTEPSVYYISPSD